MAIWLLFLAATSFWTTSSTCPSPEELLDVVANSSYHAQAHPGLVTKESVSGFKVESSLRWLKIQIFPQIALAIGVPTSNRRGGANMLVPAKFEDMTIQFAECIFQMSSETLRRKMLK